MNFEALRDLTCGFTGKFEEKIFGSGLAVDPPFARKKAKDDLGG